MALQLKPCPFCGGKANFSRIPGQGFSILCSGCGALAVYAGSSQRDALGGGWNRRTVRHNFSMQSQAQPCPFCASRMHFDTMGKKGSILKCGSCNMVVSFVGSDDLPTTVRLWNRRV